MQNRSFAWEMDILTLVDVQSQYCPGIVTSSFSSSLCRVWSRAACRSFLMVFLDEFETLPPVFSISPLLSTQAALITVWFALFGLPYCLYPPNPPQGSPHVCLVLLYIARPTSLKRNTNDCLSHPTAYRPPLPTAAMLFCR